MVFILWKTISYIQCYSYILYLCFLPIYFLNITTDTPNFSNSVGTESSPSRPRAFSTPSGWPWQLLLGWQRLGAELNRWASLGMGKSAESLENPWNHLIILNYMGKPTKHRCVCLKTIGKTMNTCNSAVLTLRDGAGEREREREGGREREREREREVEVSI